MTETYDAIVLGSGQAGKPLAIDLASAGRRTALVEAAHVGGTCINVGCTPTKTMVASARVAYLARRAADFGVHASDVRVDLAQVRERKRSIVAKFRKGGERALESTEGLDLVRGRARFAGEGEVEVAGPDGSSRRLRAGTIVVNVGCRPTRPDLAGLDGVPWLDSSSIQELDRLPERLVVLGGGYIGLEFAQMFRRFGSAVTIVQRQDQLLPLVDPDVAAEVAKVVQGDGIEVLLGARATAVQPGPAGGIRLEIESGGQRRTVEGSHLLVAVGRTPNTDDLGAPAAGIALDERGFVRADERLRTTAPGVWAAGDVKGGPAFTHVSYDDYRVLRRILVDGQDATIEGRLVPWAVFLDPELAHVGLSEREARASGRPIRVGRMPMKHVARALEMDEARGFMKVVVDAETRRILGFTVLGIQGGELAAVVQMAMQAGMPYAALEDTIFVHPILAECLNNVFGWLED